MRAGRSQWVGAARARREALGVVADLVPIPQDVNAMFMINTGGAAGPLRMMDQVGLGADIRDGCCCPTG